MINFRFHLASLVAIFLALALGVVIGAGVIDRGVVDALDNRLDTVQANSDRIQGDNDNLRAQLAEKDQAIAAVAPHAIDSRLANADVGIVAVRGVDDDRVDQTVSMLELGGAKVTGVLWLESPWKLDDDTQVAAMAEAIGSSARRPSTLREQAWEAIAARFAESVAVSATDDVLATLKDAGFLGFDSVSDNGDLTQFPGISASMVLVVGTNGDVPASDVVMPAATAIHAVELPLVVGDVFDPTSPDAGSRGDDVAELRDSDLSESVSTVDDLERPQGPLAAALAVADLLKIPPQVGHFGLGTDTVPFPEVDGP